MKGQARKAKAKAAAAKNNDNAQNQACRFIMDDGILSTYPIETCSHGTQTNDEVPHVCIDFVNTFFECFISTIPKLSHTKAGMMDAVATTLVTTYNKFPEALNNENNRQYIKKNIICNGTGYLLGENPGPSNMSLACAVALMLIDSYDPTSPVSAGTFDERDAKQVLTNGDIMNGCQRSLVKFFVKRTPCNCLDDLYTQVKSTTSKMAACPCCKQTKERKSMFICAGCERMQYCSKTCQLEHLSIHKDICKRWKGFIHQGAAVLEMNERDKK